MREMPALHNVAERCMYPQMLTTGTTDLEGLAKIIADRSSLTPSDVVGVVVALREVIAQQLAFGNNVEIDGLVHFSVGLGMRRGVEREPADGSARRNATSVEVREVRARSARTLLGAVRDACHLERAGARYLSSERPDREARRAIAIEYLQTNDSLPVLTYARMTGISRSLATKELKALYREGHIDQVGMRPHCRYVRKQEA